MDVSAAELTATHFGGGGGLLRKKSAGDEEEEHKPRSRQELIEELIIKSKQEKVRKCVLNNNKSYFTIFKHHSVSSLSHQEQELYICKESCIINITKSIIAITITVIEL